MKKKVKDLKDINNVLGIITIIVGIYSLILGVCGALEYSGGTVNKTTYGGDAYTGIQNASATTANNVNRLGDLCSCAFSNAFAIAGVLLIVRGIDKMAISSNSIK